MTNSSLITQLEANLKEKEDSISYNISKILLDNLEKINKLTINNLAQQANCSKSAIVKFCKDLNLDGYKQLGQILFFESSLLHPTIKKDTSSLTFDQQDYLDRYSELVQKNLAKLKEQIPTIILAANLTRKAKRVFLFGKGANLHLLAIFQNYLMKLNYAVFYSIDLDVQQHYVNNAKIGDICYLFSYSGLTQQMVEIIHQLQQQQVTTILVTSNLNSPMNSDHEIVIQVNKNEEVLKKQRNSMMSFMFIVMEIVFLLSN